MAAHSQTVTPVTAPTQGAVWTVWVSADVTAVRVFIFISILVDVDIVSLLLCLI